MHSDFSAVQPSSSQHYHYFYLFEILVLLNLLQKLVCTMDGVLHFRAAACLQKVCKGCLQPATKMLSTTSSFTTSAYLNFDTKNKHVYISDYPHTYSSYIGSPRKVFLSLYKLPAQVYIKLFTCVWVFFTERVKRVDFPLFSLPHSNKIIKLYFVGVWMPKNCFYNHFK